MINFIGRVTALFSGSSGKGVAKKQSSGETKGQKDVDEMARVRLEREQSTFSSSGSSRTVLDQSSTAIAGRIKLLATRRFIGEPSEVQKLKAYRGMKVQRNGEYQGENAKNAILSQMIGLEIDASQSPIDYTTSSGEKRQMPQQAHKDIGRSHIFKSDGEILREMRKKPSSSEEVYEELKKRYGEDVACMMARLTHQSMAQGVYLALLTDGDVNPTMTGVPGETQVATPKQSRIIYEVGKKDGNLEVLMTIVFVCRDQQKLNALMENEEGQSSATIGYIAVRRKVVLSEDEVPKIDDWGNIKKLQEAQSRFSSLAVYDEISSFCRQADSAEKQLQS